MGGTVIGAIGITGVPGIDDARTFAKGCGGTKDCSYSSSRPFLNFSFRGCRERGGIVVDVIGGGELRGVIDA